MTQPARIPVESAGANLPCYMPYCELSIHHLLKAEGNH